MSLYNLVNGMNAPAAVLLSPFAPVPITSFPRFRNVFLADEDDDHFYSVYTRVGGQNRMCWNEQQLPEDGSPCDCYGCFGDEIESDERCLARVDDEYDSTYCSFNMGILPEDRDDFQVISDALKGIYTLDPDRLSDTYKDRLRALGETGGGGVQAFIKAALRE